MRLGSVMSVVGLAFALSSCLTPSEPEPLTVSVSVSKATAKVGEVVEFLVTARGAGIGFLSIEFGDGSDEIFSAGGSTRTTVNFPHTYATAGSFVVRLTATDSRGTATTTTNIVITE